MMTREELKALRFGDRVWSGGRGSAHEVNSSAWEWGGGQGNIYLAGPRTRCGVKVRESWSLLSPSGRSHHPECRICFAEER